MARLKELGTRAGVGGGIHFNSLSSGENTTWKVLLRLLLLLTVTTSLVGAQRIEDEFGVGDGDGEFTYAPGQEPPPYDQIDSKEHMCEIGNHGAAMDGETLFVHGGYVVYSTQEGQHSTHPNNILRSIDFSKPFKLPSRSSSAITLTTPPANVPELTQATIWPYKGTLYEFSGLNETSDPNYPDFNEGERSHVWKYDIPGKSWKQDTLVDDKGFEFELGYAAFSAVVPNLGKGYHVGGAPYGSRNPSTLFSVYDFENNKWARYHSLFYEAHSGQLVYVPVGKRGLLVMIGGTKVVSGLSEDLLSRVDIFDMNNASDREEGRWATQTATAANGEDGIPSPRTHACAWAASAPDGSSHQIYMYGGSLQGIRNTKELWVLSLPAFEWILLSKDSIEDFTLDSRLEFSPTSPGPREGHSCHVVKKSVMVMFGGRVGDRNPFDWKEHWARRECETTALYAMDMNTMKWIEDYDPKKAEEPYKVPEKIYKVIGGNANGGSTKGPAFGFSDVGLERSFNFAKSNSGGTDSNGNVIDVVDAGETKDGSKDGSGKGGGDKKLSVGVIVGGAVGGIAVVAAIILVALILKKRKKRQREEAAAAAAQGFHYNAKYGGQPGIPLDQYGSEYSKYGSRQELNSTHVYEANARHSIVEADGRHPIQELDASGQSEFAPKYKDMP